MGDPKKQKKKYSTPRHPWEKARIDEEKELNNEYYFKNKKEIWRLDSILKSYKARLKKLVVATGDQAEKEKVQLLKKVQDLGLLQKTSRLGDILGLTLTDIVERRLQTIVFKLHLASSMNQARQFITHGHVKVGDKKITSPNFIVPKDLEKKIQFIETSKLSDKDHPERQPKDKDHPERQPNKTKNEKK